MAKTRTGRKPWSWTGAVLGAMIGSLLAVIIAVQMTGRGPDVFWIALYVLLIGVGFVFGGRESLAWLPWRTDSD